MTRRRCLLCSLPLLAIALLTAGQNAQAGQVAPDAQPMVDVKQDGNRTTTLPLDVVGAGADEHTFAMSWSDLGITTDSAAGSIASASAVDGFRHVSADAQEKPAVIAAPLPPAIVSGLVGLAGVYAYKRRHRIH
jgi:hypothetical protein